jgi:hypothetical protein
MNMSIKTRKNKTLVRAYLERNSYGGLLVWWSDPRDPCASMRYPIGDLAFFGNLVEGFRREGMFVLVSAFGKEIKLEPTVPHIVV